MVDVLDLHHLLTQMFSKDVSILEPLSSQTVADISKEIKVFNCLTIFSPYY